MADGGNMALVATKPTLSDEAELLIASAKRSIAMLTSSISILKRGGPVSLSTARMIATVSRLGKSDSDIRDLILARLDALHAFAKSNPRSRSDLVWNFIDGCYAADIELGKRAERARSKIETFIATAKNERGAGKRAQTTREQALDRLLVALRIEASGRHRRRTKAVAAPSHFHHELDVGSVTMNDEACAMHEKTRKKK